MESNLVGSPSAYQAVIRQAIVSLEGDTGNIITELEQLRLQGQAELAVMQQKLEQHRCSSMPDQEELQRLQNHNQELQLHIALVNSELMQSQQVGEQLQAHVQKLHQQIQSYRDYMEQGARDFIAYEQQQCQQALARTEAEQQAQWNAVWQMNEQRLHQELETQMLQMEQVQHNSAEQNAAHMHQLRTSNTRIEEANHQAAMLHQQLQEYVNALGTLESRHQERDKLDQEYESYYATQDQQMMELQEENTNLQELLAATTENQAVLQQQNRQMQEEVNRL